MATFASKFSARLKVFGRLLTRSNLISGVRNRVNKALADSAETMLKDLRDATPVGATGQLRDGWFVKPLPRNLQVFIRNSARSPSGFPYLLPTELGRRAAPVPIPPLDAWVQAKFGVSPPESTSIAFAISRKKARSRTPGQHFVEKTFLQRAGFITRLLSNRIIVETIKDINS